MKRTTKALCASVLPLASVVATLTIAPSVGGASAAPTNHWAQYESRAVAAIQAHEGDGALVPQGALGRDVRSTFKDAAGKVVSLDRRALTVRSARTGSSYVLALSLLGNRQEVVTALRPGRQVTAVLRPDSGRVASVTRSAATVHDAGGCSGFSSVPQVEGTIFGILMEGTGYVECDYSPENLGELVGLYVTNGPELGSAASGSGYTGSLIVDDWAGCYLNPIHSPFQSRMIWSENGTLEGGFTSGTAYYGCNQ